MKQFVICPLFFFRYAIFKYGANFNAKKESRDNDREDIVKLKNAAYKLAKAVVLKLA